MHKKLLPANPLCLADNRVLDYHVFNTCKIMITFSCLSPFVFVKKTSLRSVDSVCV